MTGYLATGRDSQESNSLWILRLTSLTELGLPSDHRYWLNSFTFILTFSGRYFLTTHLRIFLNKLCTLSAQPASCCYISRARTASDDSRLTRLQPV